MLLFFIQFCVILSSPYWLLISSTGAKLRIMNQQSSHCPTRLRFDWLDLFHSVALLALLCHKETAPKAPRAPHLNKGSLLQGKDLCNIVGGCLELVLYGRGELAAAFPEIYPRPGAESTGSHLVYNSVLIFCYISSLATLA